MRLTALTANPHQYGAARGGAGREGGHCNRKMVPRIITDRGSLSHSVCPFCGGTYENFSNCFIASAVYGDPDLPQVVALRHYRDNHLKAHFIGRTFVTVYYAVSPHLAKAIVRLPFLRPPARRWLDAIVRRLEDG